MPSRRNNVVRIIGGEWRRRLLEFPDAADLRPTPDRIRETLFNWLGQDLSGETCVDLFAGSGALGFEAASRGARQSVLVERDPAIIRTLQANKAALSAQQVEVVRADALEFLQADARRYDVAFVDPPYRLKLLPRVFPLLGRILVPGARVYVESDQSAEVPAGFDMLRQARAGQVHCLLLKWQPT